ncbi:UNVERIFIED_ORG: integrase [Paraburkholderia sediminicola]|nr:integrase [Paraburkholderia sediminicola]
MGFKYKDDIVSLECPEDRAFIEVWHEVQEGFGVRIMRRNSRNGKIKRTYLARYKKLDKEGIVADRKEAIGLVSEMGFDDAKKAAYALYQASTGARKSGAEVRTLKAAYDDYLAVRKGLIAPDTVSGYDTRMQLVQDWLDMPLTDVTETMLTDRYMRISRDEGHLRTAKMLLAVLHAVYAREVRARRCPHNPVAFVTSEHKIYEKPRSREARFVKEREMPIFWQSIHTRLHPCARDFLLVMLFTGFRESLAGGLTWDNYDFNTRTYRVQAQVRGNKKKETFYFPIPEYIAENVFQKRAAEQRMKYSGNLGKWIIESYKRRGQPYKDARGSFRAILTDTHIDLSDHDLRDTFATIARRVLRDTLLVSRLLTHNLNASDYDQMSTTTDYIGIEDDEFRSAVERVSAEILRAATAAKQPEAA